jgi:hypothetical protein
MQAGARFLRPVGTEGMHSNIATERALPADAWSVGKEPSPSSPIGTQTAFRLSRGEALILVLVLSLGLWAATWGAVALLALGAQ